MMTISISKLKTHLSAELKKVKAGETLMVTDHSREVALIVPLPEKVPLKSKASVPFQLEEHKPLVKTDPQTILQELREDRW
jgi:prevent-host-death family protein